MLISEPFLFYFREKPAMMYVLRNNAFCWGRIEQDGEDDLDVCTDEDLYDELDEYAAEAFISAAQHNPSTSVLQTPD